MFILVTEALLSDPLGLFHNTTALVQSIQDSQGQKYVPIYKDRKAMEQLKTPSYLKVFVHSRTIGMNVG